MTSAKKFIMPVLAIILVSAVAVVVAALLRYAAAKDSAVAEESQVTSMFSFDASMATGWREGAKNDVSMAVFGEADAESCFISTEYKVGAVDIESELKGIYDDGKKVGFTLKNVASTMLELRVDGELIEYELHQTDISVQPGSDPVKEGQGIGFVQLEGGYVKVLSLCDETKQRTLTYPALEAVSVTTKS